MATIDIKNLKKVYPGAEDATIKQASLEIEDKEFIVLVGPSGCGKSTLLRMIAGLEDITDGELLIDGNLMNELSPKDRDIAMVFQNYALYPHMTVFENMAFGLKLRKVPKQEIKEKVENAADILGITHLLDRRPKDMSGGQRQRVAIGRSIVRQPKVFLFDEPLSNLDAALRVQMRAEIKKLHRDLNATIVYVTHDQIEAMTMGDRIVVLKDGNVMQFDTPMNLFNNPANKFVAGFIGSPSMNFIEGEIIMESFTTFKSQDLKFSAPPDLRPCLKPYIGRRVIFGFRPEYIYDKAVEKTKRLSESMEIEVQALEPIGSETFVYFHFTGNPNHQFCFRSDSGFAYNIGDKITIGVDIQRLRFFEADTEQRIM
ncbi:sn-glycerol-3-phosphate ABC transporter ATP-binding protein UgpC [Seonamhaeicola sp.]|uniref:ABC transporter ATP-binding protein n=1 Tax=Seonamhaeicola sp. TaxID=1912245 RepID=UPI002605999A|nr:sn-glycerol-3-phosphate ABC transporter ATP-binding protein UgpC [Seonamhaeicola sp.]